MVERLYLTPESIRGGGLLVDSKGAEDYNCKGCILSKSSTSIDDESVGLYTMNTASDTNLTLSAINPIMDWNNVYWFRYVENGNFYVKAKLTDGNNTGVSGKTVVFTSQYKPATESYTTDSSGEITAECSSNVGSFTLQCKYAGDSTSNPKLANSISNLLHVRVGGANVVLSIDRSTIYSGGFINLTVTVTVDGMAIRNCPVAIMNGETGIDTGTTNTQGKYTKKLTLTTAGSYNLVAYVGDEHSNSVSLTVLPAVTPDLLDLTAVNPIIQTGDTDSLIATLTGSDGGVRVGVPGETVYFFEEFIPNILLKGNKHILQSGETSTLTGQLIDTEDGSLVRESGDNVYFFDTNCTKYTDTASSDKSSGYIGSNTTSALSYDSTNQYYTLTRSELSQTPYWLDFGIIPVGEYDFPVDFRFSLDMYCYDRTPSSGGYNWFMGVYDGTSSNAMLLGMQSTKWVVRKYTDNTEINLVEGNNLWPTSTWHTYIMEVTQRNAVNYAKVTVKNGTTKLFENTYSFVLDYVPRLCLMSNYCVSTHYLKNINFEVF